MTTVRAIHPAPLPGPSPVDTRMPTAPHPHHSMNPSHKEEDSATTPTVASFAEANGKRALPKSPPTPTHASLPRSAAQIMNDEANRPESQRSNKSDGSQGADMQSDDHDPDHDHDHDGSDNELDSVDGETGRPTKKKKGQRFFCTDYPPCNLSFTRSEHLARHIRKHTGERPFQCHCNRRFSRLDNLRQHAQTVHVNEEIPGDSLAATGTRFQRQIRTDRVRPAGARSRASTTSSQTSHGRGHARNLSTSSIASTASTVSTISSMSQDPRIHPHPLMMAPDQRPAAGLTIDTMRASPQYAYAHSSAGPSTPTSTNYSQGAASPYTPAIGSPAPSSRFPPFEHRGGRRLSVPSGVSPFQAGHQFVGQPSPPNTSFASSGGSALASPTSSVFSARQEWNQQEADIKRRTWHPSTYSGYSYQRPATSGLSYSQTPDAPRPSFAAQAPAAASQPVRLPGFNDLVNNINRPATPPNQIQAQGESPGRPPLVPAGSSSDRSVPAPADRPGHRSWDASLHQNLNKLDIASGTPPREHAAWGQQVLADMNNTTSGAHAPFAQPQSHQQQVLSTALGQGQQPPFAAGHPPHPQPSHGQQPSYEPEPQGPQGRRQGWYSGPAPAPPQVTVTQQHRTSPASISSEGVPTPSNPAFDHDPTIVHVNGYVEPAPPHHSTQNSQPAAAYASLAAKPEDRPMTGLDALVAAATSDQARGGQR